MNILELMDRAEGRKVDRPNANSVIAGLKAFSDLAPTAESSMEAPHRLVPYLAQISHESGGYAYDKELWGPTAQQKKYDPTSGSDVAKQLGNVLPGDGLKFRGRTGIQNTGRGNARSFTGWSRARWPDSPDFEQDPDAMLTDPWEGLSPIWFWDIGNSTGQSLNRYADAGNFEAITRKINGWLTGYEDRCIRYTRYGLAMLDLPYTRDGIKKFQTQAGFTGKDVDGIAGQKTRDAIHVALKGLQPVETTPVTIRLPVVDGYVSLTKEAFQQALEAWGKETTG